MAAPADEINARIKVFILLEIHQLSQRRKFFTPAQQQPSQV
jgi:hypothetical protein